MLSKRIVTILPKLSFEESLEITKLQSVAGLLQKDVGLVKIRPFRTPHYTSSRISIIGGGRNPKPGEISLAHYGVLFFDELPEFSRSVLESLRVPLEDRTITVSRVNATVKYPCNFIFIASMNPCPCGYLNDSKKECTCTPNQILNYRNKISGPILDRIDMHVEVQRVEYKNLQERGYKETSKDMRARVNSAREKQIKRYENEKVHSNSELTTALVEKYCVLSEEAKKILESAFELYGYSARTYIKVLKLARTIADLEDSKNIEAQHVAEAVQYRILDRSK